MLATIDSGAKAGAAVWREDRQLAMCRLVKERDIPEWQAQARAIGITKAVVELPIYHTEGRSKVSPATLITLGFSAGRLVPAETRDIETIWPVTWKGGLPDEILYRRIFSVLTPREVELIPELAKSVIHNVWDAIGIGLHVTGRMPRRMFT